jgi:hypothetical protein
MKDGTVSSLFIDKKKRLPFGVWMDAENHATKGYVERKGWHCTLKPHAPHLSMKGRVWAEVEVYDFELLERPEKQGGMWVLAQKMKINKLL